MIYLNTITVKKMFLIYSRTTQNSYSNLIFLGKNSYRKISQLPFSFNYDKLITPYISNKYINLP